MKHVRILLETTQKEKKSSVPMIPAIGKNYGILIQKILHQSRFTVGLKNLSKLKKLSKTIGQLSG